MIVSHCISHLTYRLVLLALILVLGTIARIDAKEGGKLPNLLFILTDQHRRDGVEAYDLTDVKTEDLIIGDEILTDTSGSFTFESITSKELIEEELETVNLNVEPSDVYFAGGVLVHNVHSK